MGWGLIRRHSRCIVRNPSRSRGACGVDEGVAALAGALLRRLLRWLRRHHDGVLVHQLAGRVGECRQGKRDAVHLSLVHTLLVLLLKVTTPVKNESSGLRPWQFIEVLFLNHFLL